jgi:hypothetical protein
VGVELGRAKIRVAEHLLDAPEIGAPFQQVRGEGMAEEVGVHAGRLQTGLACQPAQDEKDARAGERAALRVEEELGAVPAIQMRPAAGEVRRRALAASRPSGTTRSLSPLPMQRTILFSRSTRPRSRPTASPTRSPAP